jgi:hypothetical protein
MEVGANGLELGRAISLQAVRSLHKVVSQRRMDDVLLLSTAQGIAGLGRRSPHDRYLQYQVKKILDVLRPPPLHRHYRFGTER